MGKQRKQKQRRKYEQQFTVRMDGELAAWFEDQARVCGYSGLPEFLQKAVDGFPSLAACYAQAMESVERQGRDLRFLADQLEAAGGPVYEVIDEDELRRREAARSGPIH